MQNLLLDRELKWCAEVLLVNLKSQLLGEARSASVGRHQRCEPCQSQRKLQPGKVLVAPEDLLGCLARTVCEFG